MLMEVVNVLFAMYLLLEIQNLNNQIGKNLCQRYVMRKVFQFQLLIEG